jgi:hypothetical protein
MGHIPTGRAGYRGENQYQKRPPTRWVVCRRRSRSSPWRTRAISLDPDTRWRTSTFSVRFREDGVADGRSVPARTRTDRRG